MARNENPPFELGHTYFEDQTADLTAHVELEGKVWMFEDVLYSSSGSAKPYRTGKYRYMQITRNAVGDSTTLVKKLIAKMKITGSAYEEAGQVVGLTASVADFGYPIDEYLSAAVPTSDLFWLCVGGPALVTTDSAGTTTITPGLWVVPGAGTAGRVVAQDVSVAAGSATFNQINNAIGKCILTIAAVSTDFLVDVQRRFA